MKRLVKEEKRRREKKTHKPLDFRIYHKKGPSRVTFVVEISDPPVLPFTSRSAWRNGTPRMTNCHRLEEERSRKNRTSYTYVSQCSHLDNILMHICKYNMEIKRHKNNHRKNVQLKYIGTLKKRVRYLNKRYAWFNQKNIFLYRFLYYY